MNFCNGGLFFAVFFFLFTTPPSSSAAIANTAGPISLRISSLVRSFDSCPVLPQIISKDLKDINEGKMFLNLGRHKFKKLGQISNKSNNYEE